MSWEWIGTISPEYGWQNFQNDAIGGSLFRITQSWDGEYPGWGPAYISFYYPNGGRYGFYKFWSGNEPLLFTEAVPVSLQRAGYIVRTPQVQMGGRTRLYENANWQVTLELWLGPSPNTPQQIIDGGEY